MSKKLKNMGIAYKNFWSLNTDEAVVSGILRGNTNKNIEVLMPMNAQMKGVDLVFNEYKNKKVTNFKLRAVEHMSLNQGR